jgi:hypothetical protein
MLGTRQGDIDPALVFQEAYIPVLVGADCRKDHEVHFSSLPALNASHVIFKLQILQELP